MKNKRLAILLVILVFFAVVVVLSSTVFSLATVEINFLSTTHYLTNNQAIIDSGKFKYGENVFFSSKKTYISNLEKANPYLRVLNIETIFPNKLVINAAERQEVYVIKLDNNKYAKTDEFLKVLEISNVYQNNTENGIELFGAEVVSQTGLTAGDFFETSSTYLTELFNCLREWNTSYVTLKSKIQSIQLNYNGHANRLLINMRSGVQIIIRAAKNNLSDKLNLAFSFYDQQTDANGQPVDYTKSGIIEVFESETDIYASYRQVD